MKYINVKTSVKFLALFLFFTGIEMFGQSTILKLPTTDNTSSFDITKSDSTTIFKLFGDGGFYAGGTLANSSIPIEGMGIRFMWYPGKRAFRVGYAVDEWNDDKVGSYSISMGFRTIASGITSFSTGSYTVASGQSSVAIGGGNIASGEASLATGGNTEASGYVSTAMGYETTASGNYSFATGRYTVASGQTTTAIGDHTIAGGDFSTAMGNYVNTLSRTGSFIIGDNSTSGVYTSSSGDNQMTMRFAGGYRLFTNSAANIGAYLTPNSNSWTAVSDSTKKENYINADGEYFLSSLSKLKLGSWNYKTQDSKEFRHYGPMAQEIFHYFGKDEIGTIGNDTTLATADMDGIMMIMLQALEKRTDELQNAEERISNLENELLQQSKNISEQQTLFEDLKNELLDTKKIISTMYEEKYSSDDRTLIINQEN